MCSLAMEFSATHVAYYHLCHRKLWLFHRRLQMEPHSDTVGEGKLLNETAYPRRPARWRELNLGFVKIDQFDPRQRLVREIKKSPKLEHAHIAQVQYYLYILEQAGIPNVSGLLEYPQQRQTREVQLTDAVRREITGWLKEIERITTSDQCPELVKKTYCKSCAYQDFCFA